MKGLVVDQQGQLVSKTDQVLNFMRAGDYASALRLAKTFRMGLSDDDAATLRRAHEAPLNPGFWQQIGGNPDGLRQDGIRLLHELYGSRL